MKRVLIIGGYGNFGQFISKRLSKEKNIQLIIAGRSLKKARTLSNEINAQNIPEIIELDINKNLSQKIIETKPDIVVHTSGPFQSQSYHVAKTCIEHGCHYIDLSDAREFVSGIDVLDSLAKDANVLVVSGASSVPCLTSAIIDHYNNEFSEINALDYGITTAQKTTRGLATTAAILSYTGKPFKTLIDGNEKEIYGWQSLHARKYWKLGWRLLGNCNVPDLEIFPKIYPDIKTIRFYAELELPFIHITLWILSWLVRIGLIRTLEIIAPLLLKLSFLFDRLGTANSGFHMILSGKGKNGADKMVSFDLTAKNGSGPYIPCMPAILLTKRLADEKIKKIGAIPCVGIITKNEYLDALSDLDIQWTETIKNNA